ncbi:MAG TPA: hypothetical protein VLX61_14775 [Anaerolineales bacterium]|nr:hypothetical protein [Anaerolineales bacterium]
MSNFNYNEQPTPRPGGRKFNPWDLLSIVVLLVTVCIAGYFVLVFINPSMPLNPFPPLPTPFQLPTATITPIQLPATWTATNPPFMTATDTPPPTFTLIPTETAFSLIPPTSTPPPSATPKAPFSATPQYIPSTYVYPDLGCNFFGIGGTIEDSNGADIISMVIGLYGTLNGQSIPTGTVTVSGLYKAYGTSGFQFDLGKILHLSTVPVASTGTLYLQVLDQTGQPLSDNIYINTYNNCSKNLVLVRFKKR